MTSENGSSLGRPIVRHGWNKAAVAAWFLAIIALIQIPLFSGVYDVSPSQVLAVLWAKLSGLPSGIDPTAETVIWSIRLPRLLGGILVGAALSTSGAVYQGLFRNPLVSPDILGVSTGASLGAILGLFLSLPVVAVQLLSFIGGLLTVSLVYGVGQAIRQRDPILAIVLVGIAVGSLAGAMLSILKVLADPYNQLPAMTYWLLGSLSSMTMGDALSIAPAIILGLIPLWLLRWRINLLTLDEAEAQSLGINTRQLRAVAIVFATLMTAAAVSVSGVIGWVGLMIPHIARLLVGPDFAKLLPVTLALGGCYLVSADLLARSLVDREIPLGIITAAMGAPFFLFLLAKTDRTPA